MLKYENLQLGKHYWVAWAYNDLPYENDEFERVFVVNLEYSRLKGVELTENDCLIYWFDRGFGVGKNMPDRKVFNTKKEALEYLKNEVEIIRRKQIESFLEDVELCKKADHLVIEHTDSGDSDPISFKEFFKELEEN